MPVRIETHTRSQMVVFTLVREQFTSHKLVLTIKGLAIYQFFNSQTFKHFLFRFNAQFRVKRLKNTQSGNVNEKLQRPERDAEVDDGCCHGKCHAGTKTIRATFGSAFKRLQRQSVDDRGTGWLSTLVR